MFRKLKAGSTSVKVPVRVLDSSSTSGGYLSDLTSASSGLTGKYRRNGSASWTAITIVSATAGTFTSGGFAVPTSGPTGSYEIHVPDAAFAAGVDWVEIEYYGVTNMVPVRLFIELDAVDYQSATNFGLSKFADIEADTQDIQGRIPVSLVGGRMDASVGAMAANTLTASALANDAVTEIQSGLATSSALEAVNVLAKLAASGATGTIAVTDNNDGTLTLVFKDTDGTTTLATVLWTATTGERTRLS